jgi:hypothetical protein
MVGGCGLDASDSGEESLAAPYEHGNELSVPIKGGEFLE